MSETIGSSPVKVERPAVGLALGGGGARGLAHIGVLKVLERAHVPVDYISGTSIGAIIGAAYAAGMSLEEIESLALRISSRREQIRLIDLKLTGNGLLKGTRLYRQFSSMLGEGLTFADLKIPLVVQAVDLITGREVTLIEGLVADAIRASMSVPGVFEPAPIGGMLLADGGLLNNVPVDALCRANMDVKIAVDVLPNFPQNRPGEIPVVPHMELALLPGAMRHVLNSFMIMIAEMTEYRIKVCPPQVIIRPQIPSNVTLLTGFEHAAEVIAAGEAAAETAIGAVQELLSGAETLAAAQPEAAAACDCG